MKRFLILMKLTIVIFSLLCIILFIRKSYLGPMTPNHSRLGYYGKHTTQILNISHMHEQTAAQKVYLSKQQISWKSYNLNNMNYYFPKNMPRYTKRHIINKILK